MAAFLEAQLDVATPAKPRLAAPPRRLYGSGMTKPSGAVLPMNKIRTHR